MPRKSLLHCACQGCYRAFIRVIIIKDLPIASTQYLLGFDQQTLKLVTIFAHLCLIMSITMGRIRFWRSIVFVTDKRTDVWSRTSCIYTQILALKNYLFPHKEYFHIFFWLLFTFILCKFSVQTLPKTFSKNFWINLMSIKT